MASKSKAPAKKPASRNAPRSRPKKPAQIRTAAKKPAHPAKSKPKSAKSTKVAKVAKVTKVTKVTKPAAGRGAKPLKGAPPAHKVPSKKPLPRGSARSGKAA